MVFCAFTILGHHPLIVAAARLVIGPPHIRFYAGAPLTTRRGDGFARLLELFEAATLSDSSKIVVDITDMR